MVDIFVVNLAKSVERRKKMIQQLDSFGLQYTFIEAIDGSALSDKQKVRIDYTLAKKRLGHAMYDGEIGCALSHAFIYEKMVRENISDAVILEDDCILSDDFVSLITHNTLPKLGKDYISLYTLFTMYYTDSVPIQGNMFLYSFDYRITGTVAYYINNTMAKGLYDATRTISYVADYPRHLASIGDVGFIYPYVVTLGNQQSIIGTRSVHRVCMIARYIFFIEYYNNRQNYKNIFSYIKYVFCRSFLKSISHKV